MVTTSRYKLQEAMVIRPILILLLVVYHAFIIYAGGWAHPEGYMPHEGYAWIARLSYSFMLEMFVFLSGYVWAYQLLELSRWTSFGELVQQKSKRLLLPSFIFSVIYLLCFGTEAVTPPRILYDVLLGVGHMWFLPMLFWCFCGAYVITRIKCNEVYKVFTLLCLAMVSFLPLPLRMGSAMYYLFFFYLGYVVRKHYCNQISVSGQKILGAWMLFVVLFIGLSHLCFYVQDLAELSPIIYKAIYISIGKLSQIVYVISGIVATWFTIQWLVKSKTIPHWIETVGKYCFGVYLFQQFILMGLYYHTNLPIVVGSAWLPWVGVVIALSGSLLLSWLFRRTKVGQNLI